VCAHVVYSVRAVAHVTIGKSATARDARGVPTYGARVRGGRSDGGGRIWRTRRRARERCRMDRGGGWWVNRTPPLVHNYELIALFSP